jgi:tetratricopeptide (TPR) repeat protein
VLGLSAFLYFFLASPKQTEQPAAPAANPLSLNSRVFFPKPAAAPKNEEPKLADFAGSEACAGCHAEQYDLWRHSTHGRAGGRPSAKNVIGPFRGKPLQYKDAEVIPAIDSRQRYTFTVKRRGFPDEAFEVAAVIGGGHLYGGGTQSYFAEFPDGTLRFLPFDFSRHNNLWFSQARASKAWIPVHPDLSLDDLNEWPPGRILGTENDLPNCQNCHASQLLVRYDLQQQRYVTEYKSLDINCESCHGPAKRHVELARDDRLHDAEDIGLKSLATLTKDESLQICFQCHAVKDELVDGYLPGNELEEYYSLKLPILAENPHLADGRVRAFAYQQNHLYSDCYLNGSMTCVDCHEPHSQKYRDIYGRALPGRFDNGQCLDCHASKGEAIEKHTHHQPDSPGSLCVSCHAPYLQHQGIGSHVKFARSDHSIPVPRPEFDAKLGIENACKKCHAKKTVAVLEAKTQEWYGSVKPLKTVIAGLLQAEAGLDRPAAIKMLLQPGAKHPMAQAAALAHFIRNFLQPDMSGVEPELAERLQALSREDDLDVKALALASLHLAYGRDAAVRTFLNEALPALNERENQVRNRWALVLDYLGTAYVEKGDFRKAIVALQKATEIKSDDPVTLINLGNAFGNYGDLEQSVACFRAALSLDPANTQALANLGSAYARRRDFANAVESYKHAIRLKPIEAFNHLLLARLYAEMGETEKAIAVLKAGLAHVPFDRDIKWLLRELEAASSN